MSQSKLVNYTAISPNCTKPRRGTIKHIVVHHMAGNLTVEVCGQVFSPVSRQASSHYGIGSDGRIGQYCYEENRAWTTGHQIDHDSVTIEVADDVIGGSWHSSAKAMESLCKLVADICKRNGISKCTYTGDGKGVLLKHCWYQNTDCPGAWLGSQFPKIAEEANKLLQPMQTGWIKNSKGWWWRNPDGTYPKSEWKKIKDIWYYFDEKGYAKENTFATIKNKKYYFDDKCHMVTGWKKISNVWYFFDKEKGHMHTKEIIESKSKFYAVGADGKMVTNKDVTLKSDAEGVLTWKQ